MPNRVCYVIRAGASKKPGGDAIQMSKTAQAINTIDLGLQVQVHEGVRSCCRGIVHVSNLNLPFELHRVIGKLKRQGATIVLSPIYHPKRWEQLHAPTSPWVRVARPRVAGLMGLRRLRLLSPVALVDFVSSQQRVMRRILSSVDGISYLAEGERASVFADLSWSPQQAQQETIAYNGAPSDAGSQPWAERRGVVSLGRIEPRKNQVALISGWPEDLPLTIAGTINRRHRGYAAAFEAAVAKSPSVEYVGELGVDEVRSALSSSRCHVLASVSEVAPLVDLEAVAAGCRVLSTQNSFAGERLSRWITTIDPFDIDYAKIRAEHDEALPPDSQDGLPTWEEVGHQLAEMYDVLLCRKRRWAGLR